MKMTKGILVALALTALAGCTAKIDPADMQKAEPMAARRKRREACMLSPVGNGRTSRAESPCASRWASVLAADHLQSNRYFLLIHS